MSLKKHIKIAFILTIALNSPVFAAQTATLRQCYEWAKERSEDLKIRAEDIQQSQSRGKAALGSAFPDVRWKLDNTWQQPSGVEELEAKGFGGFVEKRQTESKFTAEQPIFSGLREWSAWKGFKKETLRDQLRLERANFDLYETIASVFYRVIEHETDRDNTNASWNLGEDRVKELRDFLKLGKTRSSEVYTAKAHSAALKAELDQIQGDLFSAREELSYLTGRDLSDYTLVDEIPNPPAFMPLSEALDAAKERTDLKAQREDLAGRKLRVRYERGAYWPSVDLTGNYYTERATFLEDIDWDVILSVDVPIFQGGQVSARTDEALSAYRQSALTLEQMERWTTYNVKKTYGELTAAIQEVKSDEEAAAAAEQSYNALLKEYRLGLVTNLDVLQALDFLQTQRSGRDSARLKAKKLFIQLNVAVEKPLDTTEGNQ